MLSLLHLFLLLTDNHCNKVKVNSKQKLSNQGTIEKVIAVIMNWAKSMTNSLRRVVSTMLIWPARVSR